MALYKWLLDSGAYDVELIERWAEGVEDTLDCEVDDCVQKGIVLVSTKFGKNYSTIACYPHIQFAIEDTMWHIRRHAEKSMRKVIEEIKDKIDDEWKLGFEYD